MSITLTSGRLKALDGVHIEASFPLPPFPPPQSSSKKKTPSQLRRKERRREEKLSADKRAASDEEGASNQSEKEVTVPKDTLEGPVKDNTKKPADKQAEESVSFKCDQCVHKANCKVSLVKHVMRKHKKPVAHERFKCDICKENQDNKNDLTIHKISEHDHPGEVLTCDLCQFMTSKKTCLSIHISKKHNDIEQLDGNSSDTGDPYHESYWERDYMGTVYQNYLDTIENIESLDISIEEQQKEIERAKDTRMIDLLSDGYTKRDLERLRMPPWKYS